MALIFGKTGSGKTRLANFITRQETRAIFIEAKFNEFKALEFLQLPALASYLDKRAGPGGFFRVSYSPLEDFTEYDTLLKMARLAGEYDPITLLLEECDRLPNPKQLRSYMEIIARGRHYGVNLVALTLYPYLMPRELRSQATECYCFNQHEPADLDYLARFYGEKTPQLQDLGQYDFLKWTPDGKIQRGTLKGKGENETIYFYR